MNELVGIIQNIAESTTERNMPAQFFYGVIQSLEPLTILVDNRFEIYSEQVTIPRRFRTDEEFDDHWHTIEPVDTTVVNKHKHKTQPHITHIAYWRGLQAGDKVALLRNQGGQEFLLLEVI